MGDKKRPTPAEIVTLLQSETNKTLRTFSQPTQQAYSVQPGRGPLFTLLYALYQNSLLPTTPSDSYEIINAAFYPNRNPIGSYCLYEPGTESMRYIVTDTYIFLHEPIPRDGNIVSAEKYVLISIPIQTPYTPDKYPTAMNSNVVRVYSARPYPSNPRFYIALFKEKNTSQFAVYSYEGDRDIFSEYDSINAPPSYTQTTTAPSYTAPVQEPVTIDSILAKLRQYFTSSTTTGTWNPFDVYTNLLGTGVFKFQDNAPVTRYTSSIRRLDLPPSFTFTSVEGSSLDAIQTQKDSLDILIEMFRNMRSTDAIERRSYVVLPRRGKTLVATYNNIFVHAPINDAGSTYGVNLLIDNSYTITSTSGAVTTTNGASTTTNGAVTTTNGASTNGASTSTSGASTSTTNNGATTQVNTIPVPSYVPNVQRPPTDPPVDVQTVRPVLHAIVAQQEPAYTNSYVSITTAPVPIVAPPNYGTQAASQSCTAGEPNCYVWTFTDATNVWLPGTLRFNVPLDVMRPLGSVLSGQYKLTFVGNAHVTHIRISSGSDTYDLAAIRPDNMDKLSSYQSTAVFEKTGSPGSFVQCTLDVAHTSASMKPGICVEWVVPHIDTGRWVTTGNGDASSLPVLIPKTNTVSMDYRGGYRPASVVSSFAPVARYKNDAMEYRINGLDSNTVAGKTDDNDAKGGVVEDADAQGYNLSELRSRYPPSLKTLNRIYFDGDAYKTNPHFRFRPPWWSKTSQNQEFRIACVGDSLTFGFPCSSGSPTPYPKLLEDYLKDVGILASVKNFGISGARMWSGSTNSSGVVNYQNEMTQQTELTKDNGLWFGESQGTYDLMIIWLGTNDTWFVKNTDQTQVEGDFVKIMRYRQANHYLLVEIDGFRRKAPCPESQPGTINDETCKRDDQIEKAAECINNAIRNLEQQYNNVHVARIDFMKERCPGGEASQPGDKFYAHFSSYDGIARSIFGRIMCHAIFHRETGDLRWVGAEPNPKPGTSTTPLPNL